MAETLPIKKSKSIFDELNALQQRIMERAYDIFDTDGRIFGNDLDNWFRAERELVWTPAIELEEKDHEFRLQIGLPGIDPKDVDIEVTPEHILVKAELKAERKEEDRGKVHVSEFASGNLFRAIHLPKKIDPDKVKADLKNGMLNLRAEIAEEAKGKKVKVEAA